MATARRRDERASSTPDSEETGLDNEERTVSVRPEPAPAAAPSPEPAPAPADASDPDVPVKSDSPTAPPSGRKTRRRIITAVGLLLIVALNAGLAFGGLYLNAHPKQKPAVSRAKADTAEQAGQPADAAPKSSKASGDNSARLSTSDHYVSATKNLEFDYPKDWRISADPDDKLIVLTSPKFSYQKEGGESVTGKVRILVHKAYAPFIAELPTTPDDFVKEDSFKISYSNKSDKQRAETFLTFTGFNFRGKDYRYANSIFVSGSAAYKKGEMVKDKDITKLEPYISLYIEKCGEQPQCEANMPADFTLDTWKKTEVLQDAQKVLESMRING